MKLGPVSVPERQAYVALLGSDRAWGRPEEKTVRAVWELLKDALPVQLEDLMAQSKAKPSTEEYDRRVLVAKQSLIVALDCAITAADQTKRNRSEKWRSKMLTKNLVFDALASRWSRSFRDAQHTGVRRSYDMRRNTVLTAEREILVAGVRFDTLWKIVTWPWSGEPLRGKSNPLFSVTHIHGKGRPLGGRVTLQNSDTLHKFESAVENDKQYRRSGPPRRLLFAEDPFPPRRKVSQKFCEERPYNVAKIGEESERVLAILEQSRVKFNVAVFRDDYETLDRYLKHNAGKRSTLAQLPLPAQLRGYRKLEGIVSAYRRVYRQTENVQLETYDYWNEGGWRPKPMTGFRWIKSQFRRDVNRRYGAVNFWPENVPKDFRDRWFDAEVFVPATEDVIPYDPDEVERVIREGRLDHGRWVERDVAASQIQTLAVFLGLDKLEALAASKNPTLKDWLAGQLWTSGLLADEYDGPADLRLVEFAKRHLMYFYGADLTKIIRECGSNPAKYGPGWRTTHGLSSGGRIKPGTKTVKLTKSGVEEAADNAIEFMAHSLPSWADDLFEFLRACQYLAQVYDKHDQDALRGVVFIDPFDHAEVRWHHAQRGKKLVGHHEIEVHPAGRDTAHGFMPLLPGTVDRTALKNFIAPCLTHMLDAFLSSLVVENLAEVNVHNIVELHDAWLVPETVTVALGNKTYIDNGADVLEDIVTEVGAKWLIGLCPVYDRLVYYLGDDPTFGPFVHGIKARWQERVQAQRWPRFTTK